MIFYKEKSALKLIGSRNINRHFFQKNLTKAFPEKSEIDKLSKRNNFLSKLVAAVFFLMIMLKIGLPLTAENIDGYLNKRVEYITENRNVQSEQNNYQTEFSVSESSKFRLTYTSDPGLDIFYNSVGCFYELEGEPFAIESMRPLNSSGRLMVGLINMPNFAGVEYFGGQMRSDSEKSLMLMATQLGFDYKRLFYLSNNLGLQVVFENDSFGRLAYNLYDLAPSIHEWERGRTIPEVLASRASGISYSTFQNRTSAQLGIVKDSYSLNFIMLTSMTDFFYSDNSIGLSFSKENQYSAVLAYDWSSYDTLNGVEIEKVRARFDFELSESLFSFEGQYRADGTWSLGVYGTIPLDSNVEKRSVRSEKDNIKENKTLLFVKEAYNVSLNHREVYSPEKIKKKLDSSLLSEASKIEWDEKLLERNDLSLEEIGAILKVNKISKKYDYNRVVGLDYRDMRTPEEYIKKGGICRDAANTVANIFVNNGYQAKIVYSKQVRGTPHAFVVTQDEDGSFYLFSYEYMYEVPEATSFQETAGSYSQFLNLYLVNPETHEVEDIVITPDSEYLESIAGMR